jgi:hypothetical protein
MAWYPSVTRLNVYKLATRALVESLQQRNERSESSQNVVFRGLGTFSSISRWNEDGVGDLHLERQSTAVSSGLFKA